MQKTKKAPLKVGDKIQLKYDYAFYEWLRVENELVNPFVSWSGKSPDPSLVNVQKGTVCVLEEKCILDWNHGTVVFRFKSTDNVNLMLCPSKDYLAYIRK